MNPLQEISNSFPGPHRNNFLHLLADVSWFGILSGSTISFLSIYIARLGADGSQLGLVNAAPAIINLVFALPFGLLISRWNINKAVFWTAAAQRFFYVLLIPIPFLLPPHMQIWAILMIVFIMSLPGTGVAVGFNTLFAETVPPEWRARIMGLRNALLAFITTVSTVVCGQILLSNPLDRGYSIVFAIGGLGAVMSNFHLWFVKPSGATPKDPISTQQKNPLRLEIVFSRFGKVLFLLFLFHLAQFLAIPVFPNYVVNQLKFSDGVIGWGTAFFNITVFLGSLQLERFTRIGGNKNVTGIGIILLAVYPLALAVTKSEVVYLIISLAGGVAWSMVGGALYNYLLEKVPDNDRPSHLAWYNVFLNAAILIGSMLGPIIGSWTGLPMALVIFGIARALAGLAILRWG